MEKEIEEDNRVDWSLLMILWKMGFVDSHEIAAYDWDLKGWGYN